MMEIIGGSKGFHCQWFNRRIAQSTDWFPCQSTSKRNDGELRNCSDFFCWFQVPNYGDIDIDLMGSAIYVCIYIYQMILTLIQPAFTHQKNRKNNMGNFTKQSSIWDPKVGCFFSDAQRLAAPWLSLKNRRSHSWLVWFSHVSLFHCHTVFLVSFQFYVDQSLKFLWLNHWFFMFFDGIWLNHLKCQMCCWFNSPKIFAGPQDRSPVDLCDCLTTLWDWRNWQRTQMRRILDLSSGERRERFGAIGLFICIHIPFSLGSQLELLSYT